MAGMAMCYPLAHRQGGLEAVGGSSWLWSCWCWSGQGRKRNVSWCRGKLGGLDWLLSRHSPSLPSGPVSSEMETASCWSFLLTGQKLGEPLSLACFFSPLPSTLVACFFCLLFISIL